MFFTSNRHAASGCEFSVGESYSFARIFEPDNLRQRITDKIINYLLQVCYDSVSDGFELFGKSYACISGSRNLGGQAGFDGDGTNTR